MSAHHQSTESPRWSGPVRLWRAERVLGTLHVDLYTVSGGVEPGGRVRDETVWRGRVHGSDYLVWGANLTKSHIEFPWGERAEVVLRSGGRVQGLGPRPTPLLNDVAGAPRSAPPSPASPNPDLKEN